MEFGELKADDEAAFIVELNTADLSADTSDFRGHISFPLISASFGDTPGTDKINLVFIHAYAFYTYDAPTFDSLSACSAISATVYSETLPATNLNTSTTPTRKYVVSTSSTKCNETNSNTNSISFPAYAATKKRYKPVERRTQPVPATLPEKFRVVRHFPSDPLEQLPQLNPNPPPFVPTGRYTQECKEFMDSIHDPTFLWPQEMAATHHLMMLHEKAFVWCEEEKGQLKTEYFPPVEMPVIEHTPLTRLNFG
ncbi:MAG: hypothetical protein NXY57DRAFT_969537 [Lentinula lateritia]|nr:MAG: hypothetical protein NXY57DRAFT_969537 [Lentinula lateritia]